MVKKTQKTEKVKPKFFKIVVCNPCQSSPSLTIFVPLWFIIILWCFFYLSKLLFPGLPQFKGNFVGAKVIDIFLSFSNSLLYLPFLS